MTQDAGEINLSLESVKGFFGKIVQYLLGFAGTVIFARILGPTSFGGFYTLFSVVFLAQQPLVGVANAIEKRFSEVDSDRGAILGSVFIILVIVYTLVGVGLWFTADQLAVQTNVTNAALVFFALFVAKTLFTVFQQMLSASGYPAFQIWNDTLRSMLTFPLQLLFVLGGFAAAGMGYGLAAASFLTVPVGIYFIRTPVKKPSKEVLGSIWEYVKYSVPGAIVSTAYSRLDILLLGFILSTGAAGQYEIAYKLTTPAILVSSAVAPALFPKISNLYSRGEAISEDISNALAFTSILAIPIFFGALAIPRNLVVTVYGGEYRTAGTLLIGLALYQVLQTQVRMYGRMIGGMDKPKLNLQVSTLTLIINIIVGIGFIFEYGALGVVIGTVIAEFVRYLAYIVIVRKLMPNVTVLPRALLEQVGSGGLMFIIVEMIHTRYVIDGWLELLVVVGVGAAVYGVVLLGVSRRVRVTIKSVYRDMSA
jgi:O-antigen/teichoic acid export membrane protein